jgi:hypothetical protein
VTVRQALEALLENHDLVLKEMPRGRELKIENCKMKIAN